MKPAKPVLKQKLRGRLYIMIEGPGGNGKTTMANFLSDTLRSSGADVTVKNESGIVPQGFPPGKSSLRWDDWTIEIRDIDRFDEDTRDQTIDNLKIKLQEFKEENTRLYELAGVECGLPD
jgi:Cdc6-like AAA superfamily ATPase